MHFFRYDFSVFLISYIVSSCTKERNLLIFLIKYKTSLTSNNDEEDSFCTSILIPFSLILSCTCMTEKIT